MIVTFINDETREAFNYDNVLDLFIRPGYVMLTRKGSDGKAFKLVVFNEEYTQIIIGGFENDCDRKEN